MYKYKIQNLNCLLQPIKRETKNQEIDQIDFQISGSVCCGEEIDSNRL